MGVVFFPSLPFMGVMLFPSFVLGNVSGEGGALLVRFLCFLFFFLFLSFSSSSPSLSFSLPSFLLFFHISFSLFPFLTHKLFPSLFSSSPLFHLFPFLFFFFLRELLVRMTLLIVIECNLIGINRDFSFWSMIFHIQLYVIFLSVICLYCLQRLIK